jgi:hypothetical protein
MVDLLLLTWCNVTYVYLHIQMIWRSRYIMLLSFSRSRDYPLVGNTAPPLHRRSWHGPPPFSNFLFTNLFSIKCLYFFLLFHHFFLILTCSCQYSYNLMLTSNCMCRPYSLSSKSSDRKCLVNIRDILKRYF